MTALNANPTLQYRGAMQLGALCGRSHALARMFRSLQSVAALDRLHVLLSGETGTGKSLVARVLHENSPRRDGPFVEVNCAAIPRDLCEAEFFGCARNAYTQAAERMGRFAAADQGTLFLDEVGELALELQAKLLRVLDHGCYERLGEDRTRQTNVRIVAATNRSLEREMSSGRFRCDLFYRLSQYPIRVPSLAERPEDIEELAVFFVEGQCKALGLAPIRLEADVGHSLSRQAWPGNVRQLQSVVVRAVIEAVASGAQQIELQHFLSHESGDAPKASSVASAPLADFDASFSEATRAFQRRLMMFAIEAENGNVTKAAKRLGLSRSYFYTLLGSPKRMPQDEFLDRN